MVCTPGSLRDTRSRNSYPSIPGICTSTSTSRHWPHFTRRSASSGLVVGMASYPISPITADNISSCAGSSSRMHGVNEDFGATISTVFDETKPTMQQLLASRVPLPHLLRSSPASPLLEFPKDRLGFATPLKILPLLLFAGGKSGSPQEFFPDGC